MNLKSEWKLVLEAQPLPSLLPPREGPELGEDRPPRGGLGEVFGLSTADLCGSLPAASSAPGNLLIMYLHSKPHVFVTCGISLLNVSSDRPRTHLAVYVVRGYGLGLGPKCVYPGLGVMEDSKGDLMACKCTGIPQCLALCPRRNLDFWKSPRVGCWAHG